MSLNQLVRQGQQFTRAGAPTRQLNIQDPTVSTRSVTEDLVNSGSAERSVVDAQLNAEAGNLLRSLANPKRLKTFGIRITNGHATETQRAVLFDTFDLADDKGIADGADITIASTTQTNGVKYASLLKTLGANPVLIAGFNYKVADEDDFTNQFELVNVNIDSSSDTDPQENNIALAENPAYQNPKLLKIAMPALLNGYRVFAIDIAPASSIILNFVVVAQFKVK